MATTDVISYYSNGFVVEHVPIDETGNFTDAYCQSWLLIPAENLWPAWFRGFIYIIAIAYLFIGVAIGSDVFMTSIEVITSKKRTIIIWDEELGENTKKEVLVWNETVANLTLLALGSSAPEILLATVETINEILSGNQAKGGGLGFYTIVGSAAFNLLVITGICIISVPSPSHKSIRELGVFILTSMWSLLAYVWLLCVMLWTSPNVVEPWEAWLTLIFFPLLVITAYAQDNGWWMYKLRGQNSVQDASKPRDEDPAMVNGLSSRRGSAVGVKSPEKSRKMNWTNEGVCSVSNGDICGGTPNMGSPALKRHIRRVSIAAPTNPAAIELASISKKDNGRKESERRQVEPEPAYRAFARARFRHAAIWSIGGRKRKPINLNLQPSPKLPVNDPKLLSVVSKIASIRKLYSNNNAIQAYPITMDMLDESSGNVAFASSAYSTLESAGELTIDVLLHRRKRPKGQTVIPTTNANGKFDTQIMPGVISVDYETREGTAKINKDFKYTSGTLIFPEDTYVQSISIPIINDDQYYPDTDFYVILKNPSGDATLGDPSVSRVTIIDDDKPGDFVLETSQLYADMEKGEVSATVLRQCGSDGVVFVHYATIDGTAHGGETMDLGVDYVHTSGKLEFKHQETSKVITIEINKDITETKNFVIILRNPSQGSHLGEHSAAVVNINLEACGINSMSRVLIDENDTTWVGQIRNAMIVGGEMDDYGNESPPSNTDFLMHAISMPWKIVFALAPTRHAYGGFPAFIISLLMIGCLTAIIEQLGHLLGCVATLKTQVTGITIIALGTSLPDTIASRTAALQDDYADASIGNITGSNSVNVFLGLGLPWVIRTMYFAVKGGQYIVDTDGLDFAVTLFDSFGAVCVVLLILRRYVLGGELGGSTRVKWASGIFLFTLWFIFIIVSSLKAYNYF
uniref:sodium/calcium exchanger 3-like isoform X1 n=1 Tax=Ciona intestinalis TaxID=7719 RepID=UPI000EF51396|nr:sodium/calcium exchanger 3-like isoform X1 [Ciona intestinalis]|eukprot:XP_026695085.1 sodium/calcium exchanger 3-like isoform X1 [Ciona intestinalis]